MSQFERETTVEERMAWGECPACGARHGEPCHPEVGFPVGRNARGEPPRVGAHAGRLRGAPTRVRLVPA